MKHSITIEGIKLYAYHGCLDEEAKIGANYIVDVYMVTDFTEAAQNGASGMAAGSMFIYQRPHNAVLISYPSNYFYP